MSIIKNSVKRQLFVIILSVTLPLVICGGILTIQGFQARIKSDHEREDIEQEKIIAERLEDILSRSEQVLENISESNALQNALIPGPHDSLAVYSNLYTLTTDIKDFAVVDLYLGGDSKYSTRRGVPSPELPTGYSVLREADNTEGTVYAMDPTDVTMTGATLIMARKISDYGVGGYAVIRISADALKNALTGAINARDGFMLTNRFFRPFCLLGTAVDLGNLDGIRSNLFKNQPYNADMRENIYISEIAGGSLRAIYITPPAFEETAVKAGYQIVMIQVIISILVCLFVAIRMSAYFSRPINTISAAMKRFRKGDFDTKIEMNREDEFGALSSGFNKMTSQLKETMREQVEAERKVNETRIEMMQAQLNPHFLYNTLDTIKWVAKANQVPEVATLSSSLATILRTSISASRFTPLSKEIDLVKDYCEIQRIRFDDDFELEVHIPDELMEAFVPKLILQPIVENSIIHGLEGRSDGRIVIEGTLSVREDSENYDVKLVVTDNGKGISDEMIALIEAEDPNALVGHLGLNNVNTIIRLYYGSDYGMKAERLSEGGTAITLLLPYIIKEPDAGDES
ncbi:MAG: sensor histidine kinase [Lachnospiraceae bacterium]|nr:sensor histidine kinase [Lachnospiraceae bacterium]